eukprot:TRINITY_DN13450_c0_g2_i1.p1 TRINITY_DN13450_c0_g2~~TRINITY_DN13450_c0_g2_i1.p1  ORF type:complete len:1138 (-),score=270.83 TRINITY_DN13450_c0_g2_i1:74-3487(-)
MCRRDRVMGSMRTGQALFLALCLTACTCLELTSSEGAFGIDGSSRSTNIWGADVSSGATVTQVGSYRVALAERRIPPQQNGSCGDAIRQEGEQCDSEGDGCTNCVIDPGWICYDSIAKQGSVCVEQDTFPSQFAEIQEAGLAACISKHPLAGFLATELLPGYGRCTQPTDSQAPATGTSLLTTSKHDRVEQAFTLWSVDRQPLTARAMCDRQQALACVPAGNRQHCATRQSARCLHLTTDPSWCDASQGSPSGVLSTVDGVEVCKFEGCRTPLSWSTRHGQQVNPASWCVGTIESVAPSANDLKRPSAARQLLQTPPVEPTSGDPSADPAVTETQDVTPLPRTPSGYLNSVAQRVGSPPWTLVDGVKARVEDFNLQLRQKLTRDQQQLAAAQNELASKRATSANLDQLRQTKLQQSANKTLVKLANTKKVQASTEEQIERYKERATKEIGAKLDRAKIRQAAATSLEQERLTLHARHKDLERLEQEEETAKRDRLEFDLDLREQVANATNATHMLHAELTQAEARARQLEKETTPFQHILETDKELSLEEQAEQHTAREAQLREEKKADAIEEKKLQQEHTRAMMLGLEAVQEAERVQHRKFEAERVQETQRLEHTNSELGDVKARTHRLLEEYSQQILAAQAASREYQAHLALTFATQRARETQAQHEEFSEGLVGVEVTLNSTAALRSQRHSLLKRLRKAEQSLEIQRNVQSELDKLENASTGELEDILRQESIRSKAALQAQNSSEAKLQKTLQAAAAVERVTNEQIQTVKRKISGMHTQVEAIEQHTAEQRGRLAELLPVDCVISDWSPWGSCQAECGEGEQHRLREVVAPAQNGGQPCATEREQTQSCTVKACARCGDGVVNTPEEQCDTGAEGCSPDCQLQHGWTCAGSVCDRCGNGVKGGNEQCDDGNDQDGDGCSSYCKIEPSFVCVGEQDSQCYPSEQHSKQVLHSMIEESTVCSSLHQAFLPTNFSTGAGQCTPLTDTTTAQSTQSGDRLALGASTSVYAGLVQQAAKQDILGSSKRSLHESSSSHYSACRVDVASMCVNSNALSRQCVRRASYSCVEVVMEARFCDTHREEFPGDLQLRESEAKRLQTVCVFAGCKLPSDWTTSTGGPVDEIDWCNEAALGLVGGR